MSGTAGKGFKLISNNFNLCITENEEEGKPVMKGIYKTEFNTIDCFNRIFYSFRFNHRQFKYTTVFLDDLILVCLANSFSLYCSSNPKKTVLKRNWPEMVAKAIFNSLN